MDALALIDLQWGISMGGYEWTEAPPADVDPASGTLWLVESPLRSDRPSDASPFVSWVSGERWDEKRATPALHRTFADLKASKAEEMQQRITAFASRYGSLRRYSRSERGFSTGESFESWSDEIRIMRWVVDAWDAAVARELDAIQRVIARAPELLTSAWQGTEEDPLALAREIIKTIVNKRVADSVSPVLVPDSVTGELVAGMSARDLRGALYHGFWRATQGQFVFKPCPRCGEWFAISSRKRTPRRRRFCSERCRTAEAKRRMREARSSALEMAKKGRRPQIIAKALELDVSTVKKWLAEEKEKSR